MTTEHGEVPTMPKKQKNVLLDEQLCDLLEDLQSAQGATYPRILTAAILNYLFNNCASDESCVGPVSIDPGWMGLALSIERGEISALDIPMHIMDSVIVSRERYLKVIEGEDGYSPEQIATLKKSLENARDRRRGWQNDIEDFGGVREAFRDAFGLHPPTQ